MPDNLLKSTALISAMTFLSRVSGLCRDVVFANLLGDKAAADVFLVAFRMPNFFRRIFGEGAFAAAFVPVFTDYRRQQSPAEQAKFLQLLIGRFGLLLIAVCIIGVAAAPLLVAAIAPGFLADAEKYAPAVAATRITFPYLFCISFVALAAAMLNTCGRFAAPAATPILLNGALIGAAIWLIPQFRSAPVALAVGVLVAGILQMAVLLPFLRREKLSIRPRLRATADDKIARAGVRQVFKLTAPAIFGVSVAQINVFVNTLLASFLTTGSIAWLYYSDRLMEFPVGVFGIALGTAILPSLSRSRAAQDAAAFARTVDWAAKWVCLICIPATVGLMVLSGPLIATIYFHGDFSAHGVRQAAASLQAFAFGLTAIVLVKIFAPGFYAHKNTQRPVRIAVIAMAANIVFSLLLVYPLRHVGLALATSLAAYINAGLLYRALRSAEIYQFAPGWGKFLCKVCIAAAGMGILVSFGGDTAAWLQISSGQRALKLLFWVAIGGGGYCAAIYLLGVRDCARVNP